MLCLFKCTVLHMIAILYLSFIFQNTTSTKVRYIFSNRGGSQRTWSTSLSHYGVMNFNIILKFDWFRAFRWARASIIWCLVFMILGFTWNQNAFSASVVLRNRPQVLYIFGIRINRREQNWGVNFDSKLFLGRKQLFFS